MLGSLSLSRSLGFRILHHLGQRFCAHFDLLHGQQVGDRVAIGRVKGFDGVRYGLYARYCGYGRGEGHDQVDVVDDGSEEDSGVVLRGFVAVFGFAQGRGHFAAGVDGWDAEVREVGIEGDGFA